MGRIHRRTISQLYWPQTDTDGEYSSFERLDGWHSWQEAVSEGYVLYPVRKIAFGKIIYFNYSLAKEMGLIPQNHEHVMNKKLEKKLLDTFSIRIINEYDQTQNLKLHPALMKNKPYMATRYLQLQHKNKCGKTSGDGRSIWNGQIEHQGVTWDVSSRGTGVTRLAPGAVEAQKPLKSGNTTFGYGCGLADMDELLGACILAEIFHNQGLNTERVLAVIDSGRGNGIGVRAGKNLFRPAHLFMFLKQNQCEALRKATHYLIERQHKNGEWSFGSNHRRKYDCMLKEITESFAQFIAQLDRDYIFAWLDWDGDNILANAGIIDYGSIRQFGLRHDEYRYDDVSRFSTSMREQRVKARQTIQTFAQLVDYLNTGVKRPLKQFANHWSLKQFDEHFEYYILDRFLYQVGLSRSKRETLLQKNITLVREFYKEYSVLERTKTKRKPQRVADGINHPAIFNMRNVLYTLPEQLSLSFLSGSIELLDENEFFSLMLADSARGRDRKMSASLRKKIRSFQLKYWEVLARVAGSDGMKKLLDKVCAQSYEINLPHRLTGDGLLHVVDELLKFKKKNNDVKSIQKVIDRLIADHRPKTNAETEKHFPKLHANRRVKALLNTMLTLVDDMKESI